jgi:hypothetical protein
MVETNGQALVAQLNAIPGEKWVPVRPAPS